VQYVSNELQFRTAKMLRSLAAALFDAPRPDSLSRHRNAKSCARRTRDSARSINHVSESRVDNTF
jgi:hypothetical protein